MEWICYALRDASSVKGNSVCLNYNKQGLYISIISNEGKRRSVIIIPELTFNTGWTLLLKNCQKK
ncbi:hypothetical protein H5410_005025 [Solanum commersonii]|uniref:Uncharacterized protein n=1 Tax=Solanum commersonii TaxID=4109 RepID=A0A9J6A6Y5_SOLCO|nr:hypothetical protein H5410_005025 [Solanum commersonii]